MPGLRERKRRKTLTAIHEEAMRLFAEKGYNAVTVADIAEAADVARATVFAYYRAKEDIVLGEAGAAVEGLSTLLASVSGADAVIAAVRDWLRTLAGWVEPDLVLQLRLAQEVPAVGAARSRVARDVEAVIVEALARDAADPLVPRLVAGALMAALAVAEQEAAARIEAKGEPPSDDELDALFSHAVAFVEGGLARLEAARS